MSVAKDLIYEFNRADHDDNEDSTSSDESESSKEVDDLSCEKHMPGADTIDSYIFDGGSEPDESTDSKKRPSPRIKINLKNYHHQGGGNTKQLFASKITPPIDDLDNTDYSNSSDRDLSESEAESRRPRKCSKVNHNTQIISEPSPQLLHLVHMWAKKSYKITYFQDLIDTVAIISHEMRFAHPFDLCAERQWSVCLQSVKNDVGPQKFNVEYKRHHHSRASNLVTQYKRDYLQRIVQSLYDTLQESLKCLPASISDYSNKGKLLGTDEDNDNTRRPYIISPKAFHARVINHQKNLQIALFLFKYVFQTFYPLRLEVHMIIKLFRGATTNRRFVEFCLSLIILVDGTYDHRKQVAENIYQQMWKEDFCFVTYVGSQVSLSFADLVVRNRVVNEQMAQKFKRSSINLYLGRSRPFDQEFTLMKYVILKQFRTFKGNDFLASLPIENSNHPPKRFTAVISTNIIRGMSDDPSVDSGDDSSSDLSLEPDKLVTVRTPVQKPTSLDVVRNQFSLTPPTIAYLNDTIITQTLSSYDSFYSDLNNRFSSSLCLAKADEVAPFAPRLYIDTEPFRTNLYLTSLEFYLLRDLHNRDHGVSCDKLGLQPSILKKFPSFDVPMMASIVTDDVCMIRPDNHIFQSAFGDLNGKVDLALIFRFVLEHGECNSTRDPEQNIGQTRFGTRFDFGNAGAASEVTATGEFRPKQLVGVDAFLKLDVEHREQLLSSLMAIYDAIQIASDLVQKELGRPMLYNCKNRENNYASSIRTFLSAEKLRNEWCTIQVKCISRRDSVGKHKDTKNCTWKQFEKTGGLCFILRDYLDTLWSIKFLANSRHAIGCYYDRQFLMVPICNAIDFHFQKVDDKYKEYMNKYDGSFIPNPALSWQHPESFFLEDRSPWEDVVDTSGKVTYKAIVMPCTFVRDFWLSPGVDIVYQLRKRKMPTKKLLELVLIGGYQTSWLRFYHIGSLLLNMQTMELPNNSPLAWYFETSVSIFGSITGGPKPRAEPPGIKIDMVYLQDDGETLENVLSNFEELLEWINNTSQSSLTTFAIQNAIKATADRMKSYGRIELGEFRLMIMIQLCALSNVILKPDPKLRNLMYPIQGKGSYQNLLEHEVDPLYHVDAMHRVLEKYSLQDYGFNAAETILCDTKASRSARVFDLFPQGVSIYLLTVNGSTQRKKYGTVVWKTID